MHFQAKYFFSRTLVKAQAIWICQTNQLGPMLVNIAKDLKLFYLNSLSPSSHTHEDPAQDTSDMLDMAIISPGLSSRDVSFSIADDHIGSDHYPIQISADKPLEQHTTWRTTSATDST